MPTMPTLEQIPSDSINPELQAECERIASLLLRNPPDPYQFAEIRDLLHELSTLRDYNPSSFEVCIDTSVLAQIRMLLQHEIDTIRDEAERRASEGEWE